VRRLLVVLAVLLVLLVAGDFVGRAVATSELRDRAKAAVRGATSSSASISSFPFLGRLLVAGSVENVHVRVGPVVAGRLTFTSVAVDLEDVRVDRDRLIREQSVRLTGLGRGTVTAEISEAEISRLAGVPISFTPGRASVRAEGASVSGGAQMAGGSLVLTGVQAPLRVRIPRAPLFPCDATRAVVKQGAVEVSCTVRHVPAELAGRAL
jgi:DUF2993 family protein